MAGALCEAGIRFLFLFVLFLLQPFRDVVYVMRYGICYSRRWHRSMRREPIAIYLKDGWPVDGLMCKACVVVVVVVVVVFFTNFFAP